MRNYKMGQPIRIEYSHRTQKFPFYREKVFSAKKKVKRIGEFFGSDLGNFLENANEGSQNLQGRSHEQF